jgi:hypothetical protein
MSVELSVNVTNLFNDLISKFLSVGNVGDISLAFIHSSGHSFVIASTTIAPRFGGSNNHSRHMHRGHGGRVTIIYILIN